MFVTFEGLEGSGKTAVMKKVESALRTRGYQVVVVSEFSNQPTGDFITSLLKKNETPKLLHVPYRTSMYETMLLVTDLYGQSEIEIAANFDVEAVVILKDRYWHTIDAYQTPRIVRDYTHMSVRSVRNWVRQLCSQLFQPDLVFYIDTLDKLRLQRMEVRGNDLSKLDYVEVEMRREIYKSYIPQSQWRVLTNDGALEEAAEQALLQILQRI